jgi:hypothetical protein
MFQTGEFRELRGYLEEHLFSLLLKDIVLGWWSGLSGIVPG